MSIKRTCPISNFRSETGFCGMKFPRYDIRVSNEATEERCLSALSHYSTRNVPFGGLCLSNAEYRRSNAGLWPLDRRSLAIIFHSRWRPTDVGCNDKILDELDATG